MKDIGWCFFILVKSLTGLGISVMLPSHNELGSIRSFYFLQQTV